MRVRRRVLKALGHPDQNLRFKSLMSTSCHGIHLTSITFAFHPLNRQTILTVSSEFARHEGFNCRPDILGSLHQEHAKNKPTFASCTSVVSNSKHTQITRSSQTRQCKTKTIFGLLNLKSPHTNRQICQPRMAETGLHLLEFAHQRYAWLLPCYAFFRYKLFFLALFSL